MVIHRKRESGIRIGLVRVRVLRPFPVDRISRTLRGKRAIGVIDRNVAYGWNSGTSFTEIKTALYDSRVFIPMVSFIDGLAGSDITVAHLEKAADITRQAAHGGPCDKTIWLGLE